MKQALGRSARPSSVRSNAIDIQLPGWVEERRFLALELVAGSMIGVHGMVGKAQAGKRSARKKKR